MKIIRNIRDNFSSEEELEKHLKGLAGEAKKLGDLFGGRPVTTIYENTDLPKEEKSSEESGDCSS
jgi:hypothetical protein